VHSCHVFIAAASPQPAACLRTAALYKRGGDAEPHASRSQRGPAGLRGSLACGTGERGATSEVTAVTFYSKTLVMKVWTAAEKHRTSVRNI